MTAISKWMMRAVPILGRTLWILWMAAAAAPSARALDGCRAADVNGDRVVDQLDVAIVESLIGLFAEREDLDGDGVVSDSDVVIVERFQEIESRGLRDVFCPVCPADYTCSGEIDSEDRQDLEDAYGRDCRPDLNRDGFICPRDVRLLESYLGSPAPLSPAAVRADLDGNGEVDNQDRDLLYDRINGETNTRDCRLNLNRDAAVNTNDLPYMLASWGSCPQVCPLMRGPDLEATCDKGRAP